MDTVLFRAASFVHFLVQGMSTPFLSIPCWVQSIEPTFAPVTGFSTQTRAVWIWFAQWRWFPPLRWFAPLRCIRCRFAPWLWFDARIVCCRPFRWTKFGFLWPAFCSVHSTWCRCADDIAARSLTVKESGPKATHALLPSHQEKLNTRVEVHEFQPSIFEPSMRKSKASKIIIFQLDYAGLRWAV